MLKDRKFIVSDGPDSTSCEFILGNGLQQGTILAPVLFTLYTADILKTQCLNSKECQALAYADDICSYIYNFKKYSINTKCVAKKLKCYR